MNVLLRKIMGWTSVIIFTVTVMLYIEGFVLYFYKGNLGFLSAFFIGPIGVIMGILGRDESKVIKVFGFYGNIIVITFGFLYWPIGYIAEWIMSGISTY